MLFISHRGNINGPNPSLENSIGYIANALNHGFHVEIDVWYNDGFWLGHDRPTHKIGADFLINDKLWCHAKNIEAIYEMSKINTRYFWHQNDDATLTSDNFIWTFPGKQLTNISICVLPEKYSYTKNELLNCYGICSDSISKWKIELK